MSSNVKTFSFTIVMCLICSLLLTATATSLKERQDLNKLIDKQKNILMALKLIDNTKQLTSEYIQDTFKRLVIQKWVTTSGTLSNTQDNENSPTIYISEKYGKINAYAIPISGYGLWSTLYGFLAVKGDGRTVNGLSFYKHGETPGLGGECEKPWFTNQFINKQITNSNGEFVSIGIAKGKASDSISKEKLSNYVDGISGATITSKGIEAFLKQDLEKYEAFAIKLRKGSS